MQGLPPVPADAALGGPATEELGDAVPVPWADEAPPLSFQPEREAAPPDEGFVTAPPLSFEPERESNLAHEPEAFVTAAPVPAERPAADAEELPAPTPVPTSAEPAELEAPWTLEASSALAPSAFAPSPTWEVKVTDLAAAAEASEAATPPRMARGKAASRSPSTSRRNRGSSRVDVPDQPIQQQGRRRSVSRGAVHRESALPAPEEVTGAEARSLSRGPRRPSAELETRDAYPARARSADGRGRSGSKRSASKDASSISDVSRHSQDAETASSQRGRSASRGPSQGSAEEEMSVAYDDEEESQECGGTDSHTQASETQSRPDELRLPVLEPVLLLQDEAVPRKQRRSRLSIDVVAKDDFDCDPPLHPSLLRQPSRPFETPTFGYRFRSFLFVLQPVSVALVFVLDSAHFDAMRTLETCPGSLKQPWKDCEECQVEVKHTFTTTCRKMLNALGVNDTAERVKLMTTCWGSINDIDADVCGFNVLKECETSATKFKDLVYFQPLIWVLWTKLAFVLQHCFFTVFEPLLQHPTVVVFYLQNIVLVGGLFVATPVGDRSRISSLPFLLVGADIICITLSYMETRRIGAWLYNSKVKCRFYVVLLLHLAVGAATAALAWILVRDVDGYVSERSKAILISRLGHVITAMIALIYVWCCWCIDDLRSHGIHSQQDGVPPAQHADRLLFYAFAYVAVVGTSVNSVSMRTSLLVAGACVACFRIVTQSLIMNSFRRCSINTNSVKSQSGFSALSYGRASEME